MNMLGKIRRLHFRDGLSLSEIERCKGLTRKTIRKWLKMPEGKDPKYRRKRRQIDQGHALDSTTAAAIKSGMSPGYYPTRAAG